MGLIALFKPSEYEKPGGERAIELRESYKRQEADLNLDWQHRVNGDGTYVGYRTLRDFYKGRQWSYKKEAGGTMRTYNYCFTIVENMTAFLTNEAPQMNCPPKRQSDPLERLMAEGRTAILNEVHEENGLSLQFQRGARTCSLNGDAYIFGAIPTFKTDEDGNKTFDNIRYYNIEQPENIRPIWADENYTEMSAFVKSYRINTETARKLFAEEIKKTGMQINPDQPTDRDPNNLTQGSKVEMTTIEEYWSKEEYLLMVGTAKTIFDYVKHDWGFLPLQYIPNIHLPGEPRGTSDLENELDPQQEYNERASDLADIIKEIARPAYWGKNLDNISEVRSGQTIIYSVGDDAEINAMPRSGATAPVETYLNDRKNDIIGLSGMNQVLYPGNQVLQSTGRALSVVMQGVNNKISLRKEWWIRAFKGLNASILFFTEMYVPDAKRVIDGNYKTDVFISSVLLRNTSDEINKFQAKIQSLTTTQMNVGIQNPSEEQKLMKEELQDEILATEIAKQPGLLHQIIQERMQAEENQPDVAGAAPNVAAEGDNAAGGGPSPIAGAAPTVSPQGAISQMAQRAGAAPKAPQRK